MLQVSSSAVKEIKRIQLSRQQPDSSLRLSIKPGGCSGLFYDFTLEAQRNLPSEIVNDGDRLFQIEDIQIIVDKDAEQYIENLAIDYSEDLMGGGFRFHNSQAKDICGCGISFSFTQYIS